MPMALGLGGFVAAVEMAPTIKRGHLPAWFSPFFGAMLGVLVPVFLALVFPIVGWGVSRLVGVTQLYIAIGLGAAAASFLPLPGGAYKWLLGAVAGAGVGSLSTCVGLGIRWNSRRRRDAWREIEEQGKPRS